MAPSLEDNVRRPSASSAKTSLAPLDASKLKITLANTPKEPLYATDLAFGKNVTGKSELDFVGSIVDSVASNYTLQFDYCY